MTNIAIFASGSGSNFENIVKHIQTGQLSGINVTALYTDNEGVPCIDRAKNLIFQFILTSQKTFHPNLYMNSIYLNYYPVRKFSGLY